MAIPSAAMTHPDETSVPATQFRNVAEPKLITPLDPIETIPPRPDSYK